ncbi:3-phosphoshikimate 1-carboxyvinyltransferase [Riemerella columbina]|uniref:3-phosphoshikimate 1-carboxyvinyltransferase n=1 Tax=Riemerella columbina TaxID=103810 RepID=UPI00035F3FFB|nr:3-phosphoshikimate 1-carboxyvinyltransferase [Riemerella columbina]
MKPLPKLKLNIQHPSIIISGSKSESNRLLILKHLFGGLTIENLSNAQDTQLLQRALNSDEEIIDIHHAGTAMRFLTSYFAIQQGKTTVLTGSERMKQRPIAPLVEALRQLGAEIHYLEKEGYPPLKILGRDFTQSEVSISAQVSSQFVSSLLLIGACLNEGLTLNLEGNITSRPYLEMTLKILTDLGIENTFIENTIIVKPCKNFKNQNPFFVESDWSSASYFYALVAIGRQVLTLKTFKKDSLQGDAILAELYQTYFGIITEFSDDYEISLKPINSFELPQSITVGMNDCPDIAQPLCVTASALKIPFKITGLATLKVKETDRLIALQNELLKIGVTTRITENSIESLDFKTVDTIPTIKTYNDHRMAMCFAPYALVAPINIEHPEVVEKSYPQFWHDLEKVTE